MTPSQVHSNSRIVTIYRKPSFIMDAQAKGAPEFLAQAKQSIGSFWDNSYSKTVGSGLSFIEQKLLLQEIIGCEAADRNFRQKVTEYYQNIKTSIPYPKGRELEIGMEKSNSLPLAEDNMPLKIEDYIAYRHALASPEVANSKEASDGNMLVKYYIFDPQLTEDNKVIADKFKDEALALYLRIKEQPEKIDMLLTMLQTDPRTFKGKNAKELKIAKLKLLAESQPEDFVKIFNNNLFEDLYYLESMINTKILQRVGKLVMDPQTGVTLGNNDIEAIAWMKNPAKSEQVIIYRARLDEALGIIRTTADKLEVETTEETKNSGKATVKAAE